jgi:hypothetical protein
MRPRFVLAPLAALCLAGGSAADDAPLDRLAERGPTTLVVGTMFTVASPPAMLVGAARGTSVRLPACRLGHGVKMIAFGAVALPFGLLVSPFDLERLPDAWMDGVVDAMQEDYCTRPPGAVFP